MSLISRYRTSLRLLFLAALGTFHVPAFALDPAIALDGYRHERWGEQEGAPRFVDALAQTGDGWLWLGGRQAGLFRFDGVRFHPYETVDGSKLQAQAITVLRPARDGALWIGHGRGGVTVLRNGRYRHLLTPAQTSAVFAIALDAEGTAWVASRLGLYRIAGDHAERMGAAQGYPNAHAEHVLADGAGRIWAADGTALYMRGPHDTSFRQVRAARTDPMLIEARDGSVWLVLGKQFERLAPPAPRQVPPLPGRSSTYQSVFDRDGNLWSGNCPVGVCVLRPDGWQPRARFTPVAAAERLDQPWQMTSLSVMSMMEDQDGSLWIGTPSGLERLRDQPVHMVRELFDRGKANVAPHPDGSIRAVQVRKLDDTIGMARIAAGKVAAMPNPLGARAIDSAPDGTLVLAGEHGIELHGAGGVRRIPLPAALPPGSGARIANVRAGVGELWLWTTRLGAWHYRDRQWSRSPAEDDPMMVVVDAAGRSYHGLAGNRMRIADGPTVQAWDAADGIAVGTFKFIAPGTPLLIAGNQGTQLLVGGRFHDLQVDLPGGLGVVTGMVTGPGNVRWLNTERGIFRVLPEDWARTASNPALALKGTLYDALDGYPGGAETGVLSGTAFAAPDGKLWFAGERGPAWIDPRKPGANPATPDVEVLSLAAGGRRYPAAVPVELGKGTEDVQIDYSTPSLRMPQRVTFRYRLAGGDGAWVDAGTRRTAFFQRLDPGGHTFEVMAINESGVPSRVTTLRFHIVPRVTQTWWFYAACALGALAGMALAYRWRMRQLAARIEDRLLVRIGERESIARSLHDTFLQSVQGLLLSMHAVMMKLPADSPVRAEFERVLVRAEAVLVEGRDEVKGLRGEFASAGEFWQTLLRDVELTAPDSVARVRLVSPAAIGMLQPKLRSDAYAIVREALTNALRHTAGTVTLHADAAARSFTLTVSDEGAGLGEFANGRPGHFGLPGMRERAALIGARLYLESSAAGTCVILAIPAGQAYDVRAGDGSAAAEAGVVKTGA